MNKSAYPRWQQQSVTHALGSRFRDHLAKDKPFTGIVLYTGEHVVPFGEGLWAVPISKLWQSS